MDGWMDWGRVENLKKGLLYLPFWILFLWGTPGTINIPITITRFKSKFDEAFTQIYCKIPHGNCVSNHKTLRILLQVVKRLSGHGMFRAPVGIHYQEPCTTESKKTNNLNYRIITTPV